MGRTWIRLWCDKWLEGTLREESLELRGAWADLLSLCGSGKYSDTGEIKLTSNLGLTDDQIAGILHTTLDTWSTIKDRLIETARISADSATNIIVVLNWPEYQPLFDKKAYMKRYMQQRRAKEAQPELDLTPPEAQAPTSQMLTDILAKLTTHYEHEIGLISPTIANQLVDFAHSYHTRDAPLNWIDQAFAEAASNNIRKWSYVKAILNTWIDQGQSSPSTASQINSEQEKIDQEWKERQERALRESSAD